MSRWDKPGVPHTGWLFGGHVDHEESTEKCDMCGKLNIRYTHQVHHPEHESLWVGCECAEKMCGSDAPSRAEKASKSRSQRRAKWLTRTWHDTMSGNIRVKTPETIAVVTRNTGGGHGYVLIDRGSNSRRFSPGTFATEVEAQLAAFDALYPAGAIP